MLQVRIHSIQLSRRFRLGNKDPYRDRRRARDGRDRQKPGRGTDTLEQVSSC